MDQDSNIKIFRSFIGLFIFCFSLTVLFLGMRDVLNIGGFCAEGGSYEIAVRCPKGVAVLMPLSIFTMLIGGGLSFSAILKRGPEWGFLFWSALFLSLGWNFFEFAIYPPIGDQIVIGWLVCGIMFVIMGIGPVIFMGKEKLLKILFGYQKGDKSYPFGIFILHVITLILGVVGGLELYLLLT